MKKFFILTSLFIAINIVYSEDLIEFTNGKTLKCKILEFNNNQFKMQVKYKNGKKTYNLKVDKVKKIVFNYDPNKKTDKNNKVFRSVKKILQMMPKAQLPHKEAWRKNPLLNNHNWFSKNIVGHKMILEKKELLRVKDSYHSIIIAFKTLNLGGAKYYTNGIECKFNKEQWFKSIDKLSKLKVAFDNSITSVKKARTGSKVTISGKIKSISFQPPSEREKKKNNAGYLLHLTLEDCELK